MSLFNSVAKLFARLSHASQIRRLCLGPLEELEPRMSPVVDYWIGGNMNNWWFTGKNWSTGNVPQPTDTVIIGILSNSSVNFAVPTPFVAIHGILAAASTGMALPPGTITAVAGLGIAPTYTGTVNLCNTTLFVDQTFVMSGGTIANGQLAVQGDNTNANRPPKPVSATILGGTLSNLGMVVGFGFPNAPAPMAAGADTFSWTGGTISSNTVISLGSTVSGSIGGVANLNASSLNNYGTVVLSGSPTLTNGIFDNWAKVTIQPHTTLYSTVLSRKAEPHKLNSVA